LSTDLNQGGIPLDGPGSSQTVGQDSAALSGTQADLAHTSSTAANLQSDPVLEVPAQSTEYPSDSDDEGSGSARFGRLNRNMSGALEFDGTHGVVYLKFKDKFRAHLAQQVLSKDKKEEIRIMLFTTEIELALKRFSTAEQWFLDSKAVILDPKLRQNEAGYAAENNPDATAVHMYKRFWDLADAEFSKASKLDLMQWHSLEQKRHESLLK